jgi:NitT/TauT family transport system permease protein
MTDVALGGHVGGHRFAVSRRWWRAALVVAGWAAFLGFWTYASHNLVNPFILPTPAAVAEEMADIVSSGQLFEHFQWSLMKTLAGFGLAVAFGLPIGFLMGRSRWWRAFFHMPVTVAGNIPGITYAVLALVIFGISLEGPIIAVALISMPYIAINVAAGLDGIDRGLEKMSHVFRRSGRAMSSGAAAGRSRATCWCRLWCRSCSPAYGCRSRWPGRWRRSPRCSAPPTASAT